MYRVENANSYDLQTPINNLKIEIHQEYSTIRAKGIYEIQKVNYRPTLPKHSKVGQ